MSAKGTRKIRLHIFDLFLIVSLVYFALLLFNALPHLDVMLDDSNYVIAGRLFSLTMAVLFLAGWILYRTLNKIMLSQRLINLHVTLALATLVSCIAFQLWGHFRPQLHPDYYYSDFKSGPPTFAKIIIALVMISVLIFVINIFGGMIKRWLCRNKMA